MASTNAHNFEASTSYFLLGQTAAQQNSKYKSYAAAVDKALKSFESTTEWADLIAALGKLGKVFSSHSKTFNDIPNSLTVSKRLSQCLHPALPSGVHLKALDTYRQIFLILGRTQNLARYLFLYASGLFPLMDHCGIKVKSELLSIFEQFLLPLGPDLRPALPGFVATLLLALEEGTEFYMRAFNLLDQLIEKVGTDAFYTCFWQAVSENLSARLPALIFINAKIEKHKSNDFFRTISAGGQKTTAHMLRALCCAADDSGSALTQRHLLDFLCTTLPLNSDRISKQNLIQLLQHCLFVLLRRDMSLNRRLYQWLLNRSNDMAFVGLPVNGVEDSIDLAFFKENALPLIGAAIRDYLAADIEALPVVTIKPTVAGVVMGKGAQVHHAFPEVRVIRLFHYMLDRPELGQLVLQESLADLLEVCCTRNSATIIQQLQAECELIDPAFGNLLTVILPSMEFEPAKDLEQQKLQEKREEEIRKNLNALLNSMEPSFLWNYFETLFTRLSIPNNGDGTEEINDEMPEDAANALESTRVRYLFPLMVLYALKNIQLDHHGDIRGRHLPNLLRHILHTMGIGSAAFSNDNLIAIVILCRHLLVEITQNNVSVVFESIQESVDMSPSKRNVKCNKELAEEQKLVEAALEACLHLLFTICKSYAQSRDRNQIGLLTCISTLVRDFADFPFYSLQSVSSQQSSCRSLTDSIRDLSIGQNNSSSSLNWLHAIYFVIDPPTWRTSSDKADFGMRSKLLDLLLYLCLRSASMIEQHLAVFGRSVSQKSAGQPEQARKTTTTVLLKPFLSQYDLIEVEKDAIFKASALVLWQRFSENSDILWLQMVALLLLRLHSRRINESSSEIEDLIVGELTSANKMASGAAARKFRDLWIFTRSSQIEEVYSGIPLKPMNRVIMVLLGFITDDSLAVEQIELKALAFSWLEDCSRNNELHKVLQMLTLMLLNPTTARVSIQFVQMWQRITQEQLPSLPANANCVSLTTVGGKQTFHHICTDVDTTPLPRHENMCLPLHCAGNSWTEYNYISCDPRQPWVSELNRLLLLPSNTDSLPFQQQKQQQNHQQLMDAKIEMEKSPGNNHNKMEQQSQLRKTTHNRTLSDIPQFDNDVESMDSFSLDTSIDQEVLDTIQHMVDAVCESYEFDSRKDGEEEAEEDEQQQQHQEDSKLTSDNSSTTLVAEEVFEQANKFKAFREQCVSSATEADDISVVGSLVTNNAAAMPRLSTYGSGDTIKRIRTGHRRQDSLQESIFSTSTQELRLFDPTELPNSTCPGDHKQPLLDETFSHMLFYAENPSMVDLGRAEKLFRTIGTLFKSDGIGRQIVSCMLFTNMHNNQASPTGGGGEPLLDSPGGPSASVAQQLMDFMARHYRHIQGDEFWDLPAPQEKEGGDGTAAENNKTTAQQQQRQSTLFEIFSTVVLYFFRSYFLNSPTNHVSEDDLVLAWKCKIAALDCFTELLHILDGIVKDMAAKEFATFVQHIYRQTKAQKVILTLMLAAIPTPPSQKGWKMPLTMDIAEFNNGPRNKDHFRDLIFAYHRSLLHLANSIVVLEYSLLVGMRYFHAQVSGGVPANFNSQQQITENQINYNSSQTRSTIREARYSVVELRLFLGVILNALKRCPERHELWLQFLIGILPYLDRALATFVVHSVEQICRNMYECMHKNFNETWTPTMSSPMSANPRSPIQFVDYRCARTNDNGSSSRRATVKYPANYILMLMESLMSILHSTVLDGSSLFFVSPQVMARNMATPFGSPYSQFNISTTTLPPSPNRGPSSISTQSGGGFSSSNMTSMVGSAISVIPGTGLINNLFGRVFTSADSGINSASMRNESAGKTAEWLEAQKELIKMLPSILAIMSDIWTHATVKEESTKSAAAIVAYKPLSTLILNILDPIVKKHKAVLINSLGTVWRFRCVDSEHKHNFVYSAQQVSIAKLALKLKSLSLNSVILSISDTLKEIINKTKSGGGAPVEKVGNFSLEVSLLEMLQECTRHVSVAELRDSWCALSLLLGESPLGQLPARASFLAFMILVHFVRRCGAETILEDRLISKSILEVCQRLIDSLNSIVAWQLESTTWLKRTLVVRQDAAGQKAIPDLSPILDQKSTASALSASALPSSETSSIRDSTISLAGIPPSRLSTALDAQQPLLGPGSGIDMKKSTSSLRSSLKDSSSHGGGQGNKRDPTDSTQAIAILAEHLTELVDSITKSEDKDKLLPSLQAVWNNTLPYLKSKSAKNVRSFLAGSQLLASISSFQYMRPIWKKNALELLCDNSFFKMDIQSLRQWLTVIDNLMTNDKSSFKELLARITTSTSTTLTTLITSKEQEYEMRSQYLKRLAFVILSSELDQYSGQLNEIQERLTENLRLCQTPTIHTQVFTCYRVLLVRMSPSSFVSIWPSMITELIQVLAQIEQHLSVASPPALDEQRSAKDEQCLQLFLAGCKLLETLCSLPSGYVAQFQLCRWTFVSPTNARSMSDLFVPYAVRLNRLLNIKYGELTPEDLELRSISLFNVKTMTSLQELHPLFNSLALQNEHLTSNGLLQQNGRAACEPLIRPEDDDHVLSGSLPLDAAVSRIEHSLYVDFAEHWQL